MSDWNWLDTLGQDARYGLRSIRRSAGFAAIVIATLALGIGANTAIFSLIHSVLLRPLPYPDAGNLVGMTARTIDSNTTGISVSFTKFNAVAEQTQTLDCVAAFFAMGFGMSEQGGAEQLQGARVTQDFFRVLGVAPALGRTFTPDEQQPGGADVAIISDSFWHNHFGGDPSWLGKTISVDGHSLTIIGILPASFRFPFQQPEPVVWLPRAFEIPVLSPAQVRSGAGFLTIIARRRPGAALAQVQSEMNTISERYRAAYPNFGDAKKYNLDVQRLDDFLMGPMRSALIVLLIAVGLMLLIACVNVASLMLARAASRQREIAVRMALGASRSRLMRQLVTESWLLSFAGGPLGVALATFAIPVLRSAGAGSIPRVDDVRIDAPVLLFAVAICVITGLVFGLAPFLQTSRLAPFSQLKEGGRGSMSGGASARVRRSLVVIEVCIALILVVGAGLLLKSFAKLAHVNTGLDPGNVTAFPFALPVSRYPDAAKQSEFFRQLVERTQQIPGVKSAGLVSYLPLSGASRFVFFCPEGRVCEGVGKDPMISLKTVSPDYFATMRIPLLRGRVFTRDDINGARKVTIINKAAADSYFPGKDALGKTLRNSRDMVPLQIVGIVATSKVMTMDAPDGEEMYTPYLQEIWPHMTLVTRSNMDVRPLSNSVRHEVAQIDPDLAVGGIQRMEEVVSLSVAQPRLLAQLVGGFSAFAMLLAAIGIYGVVAYSVAQRTNEIGIRMALGATPGVIFGLIVGQGLRLVLVGTAAGVLASLGLTRLLSSQLYKTSATDPVLLAVSAALFVVVSVAACYVPARRAMRVDPIEALRYE